MAVPRRERRLARRVDLAARALSQLDELMGRTPLTPMVPTCNEALALEISMRLPGHAALLRAWLRRIEGRLR